MAPHVRVGQVLLCVKLSALEAAQRVPELAADAEAGAALLRRVMAANVRGRHRRGAPQRGGRGHV